MPPLADYEHGTVAISHSGWLPEQPLPDWPAFEGERDTDVAVIGAGIAGAALALHLAERGVQVVVLEAAQPANGASGRNAGHVQPFVDSLAPIARWPGGGEPFVEAFVAQRRIVYELCERHGIDGDALRSGLLEVAPTHQGALDKKAHYWRARGLDVEIVEQDALRSMLGTETYRHGAWWRDGGRLNPYLYTRGLVTAAARLGAAVHGDSPVQSCERDGARWRLRTPRGSVRAQRVVVCTNGHTGNAFFPGLAQTHYPLVACALATRPLPPALLATVNPARVALTQVPSGLFPLVIDGRNRIITATIPGTGRAHDAEAYFGYLLRHLHRNFPQTRDVPIELEAYWTGTTCSSSPVYQHDYPRLYRVADGVFALMALGTWGNVMGSLLGRNVAEFLAEDRPDCLLLPVDEPRAVRFPWWFEFKIRRLLIPVARVADRFGIA